MASLEGNISSCRHCHFYRGEGRRGGNCQQLGVPVQASWSVCPLAVPPFRPSWQNLPGLMHWQGFKVEEEEATLPLGSELQDVVNELRKDGAVESERLVVEEVSYQDL